MTHQEIVDGLKQLGFNTGWAVSNGEIILWENEAAQPTKAAIATAAAQWTVTQEAEAEANATAKAALLARLGITDDEAKLLLG